MYGKGAMCFLRGNSNLKTVLQYLRGVFQEIHVPEKVFLWKHLLPISMATMKFK